MKLSPYRLLIVPGVPLFSIWVCDAAARSLPLPAAIILILLITPAVTASALFWVFTGRNPLILRHTNKS